MIKLKELQEILAKEPTELSDEEKVSLRENEEMLSDEDKEKFGDALKEEVESIEEDELDEKALMTLIEKSVQEQIKGRFGNVEGMVKKFFDGVKTQQKNVLLGVENGKDEKSDKIVSRFWKALGADDKVELKAIEKEQRLNHKFLNSDTNSEGGYLLPVELIAEVLRIAEDEYGIARQEFFNLPFTKPGDTRTIPTLASSVRAYWIGGSIAKTSSQPAFGLVTQTLKKLAAIIPWTDEFAEDSSINITSLIATLIAEQLAKEEDLAFFIGDGSATYGGFTGILNNGSVATLLLASGAAFTDMTADDLEKMQYEVASSIAKKGKYLMHRSILGFIKRMKDDEGRYIYQAPADANSPATLWTQPIVLVEAMPALSETAADTAFVIFSDLKKTTVFSAKGTLRVKLLTEATITDVDGETALNLAEQDMTALRFVERVTANITLPEGICVLSTNSSS